MDLWSFEDIYDLFGLPKTVNSQQLQARIQCWYWTQRDKELNG